MGTSDGYVLLEETFVNDQSQGVVRPTQAGRAAYGPPLPSASIQKILSARRPPFRAHQHATVRELVRARALIHLTPSPASKSCSLDVHARDENVFCA